ncbi:helix-turn-helix domain-containing protein [Romeriopsis navalis]|uniref:helix-turn-helix domain-containing protein n=1 Tax=Romeriopsis navalis TaxID=2992132 RepID=UPI0021F9146C|nr:AraC family transcriptional regulator [Romeriopsis navalis]
MRLRKSKSTDRIYRHLRPENIALCPANEAVSIESYGDAEFIVLALEPSLLSNITEGAGDRQYGQLKSQFLGEDPLIWHMALALDQELELVGPDSQLYAESMSMALAVHLIRRYTPQPIVLQNYAGGLASHQLHRTIDYIQANLDQPLSLAKIAAVVQISPHYFATLFKQSIGVLPYQYVIQARIKRAQQLLAKPELSIVEVSHSVGFQSQSHFTKVFRQQTNVTPKADRRSL